MYIRRSTLGAALPIAALVFATTVLSRRCDVLLPLTMAFILAAIFGPLANFLEHFVSRTLSAVLVVLLVMKACLLRYLFFLLYSKRDLRDRFWYQVQSCRAERRTDMKTSRHLFLRTSLFLLLPILAAASAAPEFEKPPTLPAQVLAPASLLRETDFT
jgi:hypothetical protein